MNITTSSFDMTPFEQEAEDMAEFAHWYDIYNSVDRYMDQDDITLQRVTGADGANR